MRIYVEIKDLFLDYRELAEKMWFKSYKGKELELSYIGNTSSLNENYIFGDLECTNEANEDKYIKLISDLLLHFWSENYKVVAASDFEDKLPKNGGYGQPINKS